MSNAWLVPFYPKQGFHRSYKCCFLVYVLQKHNPTPPDMPCQTMYRMCIYLPPSPSATQSRTINSRIRLLASTYHAINSLSPPPLIPPTWFHIHATPPHLNQPHRIAQPTPPAKPLTRIRVIRPNPRTHRPDAPPGARCASQSALSLGLGTNPIQLYNKQTADRAGPVERVWLLQPNQSCPFKTLDSQFGGSQPCASGVLGQG